jgi:hypothetical protein
MLFERERIGRDPEFAKMPDPPLSVTGGGDVPGIHHSAAYASAIRANHCPPPAAGHFPGPCQAGKPIVLTLRSAKQRALSVETKIL